MTLRSGKKLNDNCQCKDCEVTKSQEIHKGKEKSELEIDSIYMHAFPFPQRMKQEKLDKYFGAPNHSASCPLFSSIVLLPWHSASSRAWHTRTLGGQIAIRRFAK
ncbi:hypothetical protein H5410_035887 [Solanum commersonii]|uniref:Uncharacterized protein n=1 Tax=Solanum commersonii TaxID=4109 RepID=A0A9J5Y443_SOLCO|nr:hypothetical protein H5410_035887 [Solanum commersonii]